KTQCPAPLGLARTSCHLADEPAGHGASQGTTCSGQEGTTGEARGYRLTRDVYHLCISFSKSQKHPHPVHINQYRRQRRVRSESLSSGSVSTSTMAGRPEARASAMAPRMSPGRSARAPKQLNAWAILLKSCGLKATGSGGTSPT